MATRTRKSVSATESSSQSAPPASLQPPPFTDLTRQVQALQEEFNETIKQISLTRQGWIQEQQERELAKKREQEAYEYEQFRQHKIAADEFADTKAAWQKQLDDQKQTLETERKELVELRRAAAAWPDDKDKAIKTALSDQQKQLSEKFEAEKRLREQEFKAEKEVLALKISHLAAENSHFQAEIDSLKKSLEEAARQLKDIAVSVISSHKPSFDPTPHTSPS